MNPTPVAEASVSEKEPVRLLFLSNFYPPIRSGGYDQLCHDVATVLRDRGYIIDVVTSSVERHAAPGGERNVHRLLHLQNDLHFYSPASYFLTRRFHERQNLSNIARVVRTCKPDAVIVWGMWGLSRQIPRLVEDLLPSRVIYYLADYWSVIDDVDAAYWKLPTRHYIARPLKAALRALVSWEASRTPRQEPRFEHVLCVSAALKTQLIERGLPIHHAEVVHNGIDVRAFSPEQHRESGTAAASDLKLLYAGQVAAHKGVTTAVEAMAQLSKMGQLTRVSLTIIGVGHPTYMTQLKDRIHALGLGEHIALHPAVPREAMPDVLREHDVLVFPSIYEEPLARIVQEAMAAGLTVIGTTTGGTKELLVHGENGLTFAPEDAHGLAQRLAYLIGHPDAQSRLEQAARETIASHFTLGRMADQIESSLQEVLRAPERQGLGAG